MRREAPIERRSRLINAASAFAEPKIKARVEELGCMAVAGSPADLARLIVDEGAEFRRDEAGVNMGSAATSHRCCSADAAPVKTTRDERPILQDEAEEPALITGSSPNLDTVPY